MDKNEELALVQAFGDQLSLTRVKTEGAFFDRDYKRSADTNLFEVVSEKVVVTTQGKTVKVAFGEGQRYATAEEATEATERHWAAYFKAYRQKAKSERARAGERRRSKAYRARRRQEREAFKAQQ